MKKIFSILIIITLLLSINLFASSCAKPPEKSYIKESIAAESKTFSESVFTFKYPSNWKKIDDKKIDEIFKTSMRGGSPDNFEYIGGVYIGDSWKEDIGEAVFSIFVISDPASTGTISDEQYENVKNTYESQYGKRLISINQSTICDLPDIEIKTIGKSKETQSWGIYIIISGKTYMLDLRARKELYPDYEPIFIDIIDSLKISK
ncbi:MAG: hypothetical protein KKC53_02600 [Actinobacteria bacterium]|nr:hypothetical protein [Actinomycetota bacterium]